MASESEELAQQIGEFATGRLTKSSLGMTYILQEQGGVPIAVENLKLSAETQLRVTNLLGITELCSQLRRSLFDKASEGSIVDSSRSAPEPRSISNQDEFVRQLLGQNPRLINKLAEISSKAQVFIDVLD